MARMLSRMTRIGVKERVLSPTNGGIAGWLDSLAIALLSVALVIALGIIVLCILWYTGHWPGWLPYVGARSTEVVTAMEANAQLVNPGFEEGWYYYQGINELKAPKGYDLWWNGGDKSPTGVVYRRPEWSPIDTQLAAYLVHSGNASSKMFTTYGAHRAGLLQRVKATPGEWYTFSAWVYVWSSSGVDGHKSEDPRGRYRALVCANPWGSSNIRDDTTICGMEIVDVYDQWAQVSVTFQAWSTEVTLATEGNPWWAARANNSTWDDLAFKPATVGQVCPTCPTCPAPGPGGECNYDTIRGIVREELDRTRLGQ